MGSLEKISFSEAKNRVREFDYALIYYYSEIIFSRMDAVSDIQWEECMEARFFSEDQELHIWGPQDARNAFLVRDDGTEEAIEKTYNISNKFLSVGKQLIVKEYIEEDEDGQACIGLTRLKGIRG